MQLQEQIIGGDRRHNKRYGVHLPLRWKLVRRRRTIGAGTGYTLDMSSGGILFEAEADLPVGLNVELSIAWPMLLRNQTPLQLLITGRIVRSSEGWAAIRTVTHEFHTLSVPAGRRGTLAKFAEESGVLIHMEDSLAVAGVH